METSSLPTSILAVFLSLPTFQVTGLMSHLWHGQQGMGGGDEKDEERRKK